MNMDMDIEQVVKFYYSDMSERNLKDDIDKHISNGLKIQQMINFKGCLIIVYI